MLNKRSVLVQASSGMGVPLDDRVDIARLLDVTGLRCGRDVKNIYCI